jgi:hypothetical protein
VDVVAHLDSHRRDLAGSVRRTWTELDPNEATADPLDSDNTVQAHHDPMVRLSVLDLCDTDLARTGPGAGHRVHGSRLVVAGDEVVLRSVPGLPDVAILC